MILISARWTYENIIHVNARLFILSLDERPVRSKSISVKNTKWMIPLMILNILTIEKFAYLLRCGHGPVRPDSFEIDLLETLFLDQRHVCSLLSFNSFLHPLIKSKVWKNSWNQKNFIFKGRFSYIDVHYQLHYFWFILKSQFFKQLW